MVGVDPPDAVLAPDREPELVLERVQVAIDGPDRDMPIRAAMSAVRDPSGCASRIATTRASRASRSRLRAVPLAVVVHRHGPGG